MTTEQMDAVRDRIAATIGDWGRGTTLEEMRAGFAELVSAGRRPAQTAVDAGGIPGAWFGGPPEPGDTVIFYCHGGGYQMGSILSHGPLMADLAEGSGARVLGFDYRVAPEHRYPAALDDTLAVYRWVLDQGIEPSRMAIAGDSAGAGLALAAMLRMRDQDLPLPAAAVFLSPWLDMQARSDSYDTKAPLDPLTQRGKVAAMVRTYLGRDGDPTDSFASPIDGDMTGLPPILVHVGGHETVLGDSELLADRAAAAGTSVEVVVWDGMIHHFQVFPELDEARASLDGIGAWLRRRLG
ncbi:alpha/beta hydrolase [Chachezhania sediminis]|uniref:alpha/beta hydrolase n=1 Tax=Chachezhania sediminis TaxID=2599291 RepID=UPI00131A956A|nr:alpha/beta hydrolase [Chachezhania sediminis]